MEKIKEQKLRYLGSVMMHIAAIEANVTSLQRDLNVYLDVKNQLINELSFLDELIDNQKIEESEEIPF